MGHKNYKTDVNDAMEVLILNQQNKKKGAKSKDKQKQEPEARSFTQSNKEEQQSSFRCFKCGKKSCKGNNQCTHKNKPKTEWACMKAMEYADNHSHRSFAQLATVNENDNSSIVSSITESQSHNNDSRIEQDHNVNDDEQPAWFHFMDTQEW